MSKSLYKADPVSRQDLRIYVNMLRKKLLVENEAYIDIVRVAEILFPILFEKEGYQFDILSEEEMGNNHGLTDPTRGHVMIRNDVYERACQGHGRDRFTIAHELGHFLLHNGVTLGLARAEEGEKIKTYCDPEWQANAFAGEFLMGANVIRGLTIEEIVEKCGVSWEAAQMQKSKIK